MWMRAWQALVAVLMGLGLCSCSLASRARGPFVRGDADAERGHFDWAIADLTRAIELGPNDATAHSNLAWLLATCPQDRVRDGQKALAYARRACELTQWRDSGCMNTFAAACAEVGQFEEAARWQAKALLDPSVPRSEWDEGRARLKLYEDGKPYREPPTPRKDVPAVD